MISVEKNHERPKITIITHGGACIDDDMETQGNKMEQWVGNSVVHMPTFNPQ